MGLVRSTISVLSTLLLLLMLLQPGLQASIKHQTVCQLISGTTKTLNCNCVAQEIISMLPESEISEDDDRVQLRNETLQSLNMCEFLKAKEKLKDKITKNTKNNLETLQYCLSETETISEGVGIYILRDVTDFQKKLWYYVSQLRNLKPTVTLSLHHPNSDPVTTRPVTRKC